MPSKRTALRFLTVLAAAVTAASCIENDRTMGEGLIPGSATITLGTKTFDLPVINRVSDSVQCTGTSNMLVGTMTDEVFGTVMAHAASYILPYSDSTDYGDNAELLGAYLTLSIDSTYYLESSQEGIHQRIKIYELTSPIDSTLIFCNSITPDRYSATPVTVSDPVIYGKGDIRIDLTDEFAAKLLTVTPEEFEDLGLFSEKIHGLYLQAEAPVGSAAGGRLNYINLGSSTINLDYRTDVVRSDGSVERIDTTESFVFGYYTALNNFTTTSANLESDAPGEHLYLEGLSGIKPLIPAKALKQMLEEWIAEEGLDEYALLLSRAEIKFPYSKPESYDRFDKEHPSTIYAFTSTPWATDSLRTYAPLDEVYASSSSAGAIDRSNMIYSMDVTSHLQKLLITPEEEIDGSMDLWIAPLLTVTDSYYGTTDYGFDNSNYNKIILNGPSAENHPTITLTFGMIPR